MITEEMIEAGLHALWPMKAVFTEEDRRQMLAILEAAHAARPRRSHKRFVDKMSASGW